MVKPNKPTISLTMKKKHWRLLAPERCGRPLGPFNSNEWHKWWNTSALELGKKPGNKGGPGGAIGRAVMTNRRPPTVVKSDGQPTTTSAGRFEKQMTPSVAGNSDIYFRFRFDGRWPTPISRAPRRERRGDETKTTARSSPRRYTTLSRRQGDTFLFHGRLLAEYRAVATTNGRWKNDDDSAASAAHWLVSTSGRYVAERNNSNHFFYLKKTTADTLFAA